MAGGWGKVRRTAVGEVLRQGTVSFLPQSAVRAMCRRAADGFRFRRRLLSRFCPHLGDACGRPAVWG
ncbi:hypothetical protein GCM10018773_14190 [Streptomyces candidus]|nr:hypothetical protein GCM10018773_14190 [Streptomyces candidus]